MNILDRAIRCGSLLFDDGDGAGPLTPEQKLLQCVILTMIEDYIEFRHTGDIRGLSRTQARIEFAKSKECMQEMSWNFLEVAGIKEIDKILAGIKTLLD